MRQPIRVVAFDMIETVFSLENLRAGLIPLGLPGSALEAWFAGALRDAFALAATGRFAPFRAVMADALADTLQRHNVPVMENRIEAFLDGFRSLDAQPDALAALTHLRDADMRIVAVSNGARQATQILIERTGLAHYFDSVFSVDDVGWSKPRREVYDHVAAATGYAAQNICLVATHPWDVLGAQSAGWSGAYVSRGRPWPATMPQPRITGDELLDTAEAVRVETG